MKGVITGLFMLNCSGMWLKRNYIDNEELGENDEEMSDAQSIEQHHRRSPPQIVGFRLLDVNSTHQQPQLERQFYRQQSRFAAAY